MGLRLFWLVPNLVLPAERGLKMLLRVIALLLLVGCGKAPQFSKLEYQSSMTAEDTVQRALVGYAKNVSQCSSEMLALVDEHDSNTRALLASVKKIKLAGSKIDPKKFQEQRKDLFQIFTSPDFAQVLRDSAVVLTNIANDDDFMTHVSGIHQSLLNKEDGDRLAEILALAVADPAKLQNFLEAGRTWLCEDYSQNDLLGFIYAPKTLWAIGGQHLLSNALYLVGAGEFVPHSLWVQNKLSALEIPPKLQEFMMLMKEMMPKNNLCQVENLAAYESLFPLLYELFKTPEVGNAQRPLRKFANLMSKMYTMSIDNSCAGVAFDSLNKDDYRRVLLGIADFIQNDKTGVLAILQQAKPRE